VPVSDYHQISDVLHVVEQVNPGSVLDVGVGFGKWGILCREILELYKERVQPESWAATIDGIEIHEPYRNPLWTLAYDHIYIGDAMEMLDLLGHYDLVLCCDVIEHFEKNRGRLLISKLLQHADIAVVTSPRGFAPQGAIYGNEHERHRSQWSAADFMGFPHVYKEIGFTFMAVIGSDAFSLKSIKVNDPFENLGARRAVPEVMRFIAKRGRKRLSAAISTMKLPHRSA